MQNEYSSIHTDFTLNSDFITLKLLFYYAHNAIIEGSVKFYSGLILMAIKKN